MLPVPSPTVNVVWQPIPNSSQALALTAPVQSLLLTGGRGYGKTEAQLMRFRSRVGLGYGSHWRGIIFDKEYKNLDDLVVKSRRIFSNLDKGHANFLASVSAFKWVWDTGEELLFRAASDETDYWDYHGHEYPFIGFNELTKYSNNKFYNMIQSTNRSGFDPFEHTPRITSDNYAAVMSHEWGREVKVGDYDTPDGQPLPPIPLELVSTTNPYGPGHNWVKQEYIDPAPYGKIVRRTTRIFDPKTQEEIDVTRTQVTLFGTFRENPYLSPLYIAKLYEETDENILKAWLTGDWDIVAGGAFDDVWKKAVHVVPRFKVPANWHIDRALDWGSTHPFSVGWFAEANGEEVTLPDGSTFCPQPGSLIQIAECYGSDKIGTNTGKKWGAKKVATAIKEIETELHKEGWIVSTVWPGPADNQIWNVTEKDTDTIGKIFEDNGINWEGSIKSPGSRVNGLELVRGRMEAAVKKEAPAIYFMDNCRASIATIPILPRDEKKIDDVDTSAEDHAYDMVRYRVLKGNNRTATVIKINFPR
jgi:hypothetical protein